MQDTSVEIDYLTAKSILEREMKKTPSVVSGITKLPTLLREQNETRMDFPAPGLNPESVYNALLEITNHIPYLRIHSLDKNYATFQALNENLFDSKNLTQNIKFRFLFSGNPRLEIQKPGNLTEREILSILAVFRYVNPESEKRTLNPKDILHKLGVEVFDPTEAELKGRFIDFSHIYGYESVKREIQETIIMPLKNPDIFSGITNLTRKNPTSLKPRAILFEGEPGVGKTTMARAVACLCHTPMVYVPIESIMSKYYGESAKNLSMIFDAAELFPSAMIFLDEIDSLAGRREDGMFEATKTMLSVLLRKLDGFEGKPGTITLGATNRKADLDSALLSRFDKSIYFPLPNKDEVAEILTGFAIHLTESERREISQALGELAGRKIKDYCDFVERKWATELLESGKPASPPPFSLYLDVANFLKKTKN